MTPRAQRAMHRPREPPELCFKARVCSWHIPAGKEATARAGAGPGASAVIRLYSSDFRNQKHVYYQALTRLTVIWSS